MSDLTYRGDGRTRAFPVTFPFFADGDVEVLVDGTRLTTGFKVEGGVGGGMVVFTVAPPAGVVIMLRRLLDVATPAFQFGGTISAKALGHEFQRLSASLERVAEDVGRAVTRSPFSASTADLTLPDPVPGRSIVWNADGTGLANSGGNLEAVAGQAAAYAAASSGWADKAAASATRAAQAAEAATAAGVEVRAVADDAMRTVAEAADLSTTEARKAASIVASVSDPAAAYRKQKLLGLW